LKRPRPAPEKLRRLLHQVRGRLAAAGIDNPVSNAELIIAEALQIPRAEIYLKPGPRPGQAQLRKIRRWTRLRERRMPFEYIARKAWFREIELAVSPEVLVPRPETEILVEQALSIIRSSSAVKNVLDLGTGSGAIILSIAHELKSFPRQLRFFASDASGNALALARKNARRLKLQKRIEFRQGKFFAPFRGQTFDLIVCNPPYIPTAELPRLMPEVSGYEPRLALDGGKDGLGVIRQILAQAPGHLAAAGRLIFEIGAGQAPKLPRTVHGLVLEKVIKDWSKIDRIALYQLSRPA